MIKKAATSDHDMLTNLSFASKRYWKYDESYISQWHDELTITPLYIKKNIVYILTNDNSIIAYYSLVENKKDLIIDNIDIEKGWWLEHMFILPTYIRKGNGKKLMNHLKNKCRSIKIEKINIFVDPHAVGFYKKMGCTFVRMSQSSIPGRMIPIYSLSI